MVLCTRKLYSDLERHDRRQFLHTLSTEVTISASKYSIVFPCNRTNMIRLKIMPDCHEQKAFPLSGYRLHRMLGDLDCPRSVGMEEFGVESWSQPGNHLELPRAQTGNYTEPGKQKSKKLIHKSLY